MKIAISATEVSPVRGIHEIMSCNYMSLIWQVVKQQFIYWK